MTITQKKRAFREASDYLKKSLGIKVKTQSIESGIEEAKLQRLRGGSQVPEDSDVEMMAAVWPVFKEQYSYYLSNPGDKPTGKLQEEVQEIKEILMDLVDRINVKLDEASLYKELSEERLKTQQLLERLLGDTDQNRAPS